MVTDHVYDDFSKNCFKMTAEDSSSKKAKVIMTSSRLALSSLHAIRYSASYATQVITTVCTLMSSICIYSINRLYPPQYTFIFHFHTHRRAFQSFFERMLRIKECRISCYMRSSTAQQMLCGFIWISFLNCGIEC